MGHQIVKKFDPVRTTDGQEAARKLPEQSTRLANSVHGSFQKIHRGDYSMAVASHDPERIERVGRTALKIRWIDGHESLYSWSFLRVSCPCATCKEGPSPPSDPSIQPLDLQPVGRYAMTIRWSDGHATGIFSYEYLRSLCACEACRPNQMDEG